MALSPAQSQALADSEKGIADLIMAAVSAAEAGGNSGAILSAFTPVVSDLMKILMEVSNFPSASQMSAGDYEQAVASFAADLVLPASVGPKAAQLTQLSLTLAEHLATVIVPDVLALVDAAKA